MVDIMEPKKKITIIGAGPGGYETALAAASSGLEVVLVSDSPVGGVCLNEGCIPTKTFCRNAELLDNLKDASEFGISTGEISLDFAKVIERKNAVISQLQGGIEFLLKSKNVRFVRGRAELKDKNTVIVHCSGSECPTKEEGTAAGESTEEIVSDFIVIATGSVSATLPITGADAEGVVTSREMLSLESIPQRLCIIGAGVIGLEFASIFNSFGSEVTVLEYCKDILPHFDTDLAKRMKQALGKKGIKIETGAQVKAIERADTGGSLSVKYSKKDVDFSAEADKVLMAVGRRPAVQSLNLDAVGIEYSPKGIVTDSDMRTNVPNIFAIGDIRGGIMLAHAATFEGKRALNAILADIREGSPEEGRILDGIDFGIIPAAVFTRPEVATVGLTEEDCKDKELKIKCLKSMFRANGKAVAMGEADGYCKIITDAEDGRILGCHLFGPHASDIIQEVAALMNKKATIYELQDIIHAHPTLSEVILSAAGI